MSAKSLLIISLIFSGCINNNPSESISKKEAQKETTISGEKIYTAECAMCHSTYKDGTGPPLRYGLENLGNKERVVAFVQNSRSFTNDHYVSSLKKKYQSLYNHSFQHLSAAEIMAIIYWSHNYIPKD